MPLGPGNGLVTGYTMTRSILADAIALVRGDRYYTTDFTRERAEVPDFFYRSLSNRLFVVAANLTAWGYQDCARDMNNVGITPLPYLNRIELLMLSFLFFH